MASTEAIVDAALVALHTPLSAWERFDLKAIHQEPPYRAAALLLFMRERDSIAFRMEKIGQQFKATSDPHPSVADPYIEAAILRIAADYAPGGAYHEAWLRRYRELLAKTIALGGGPVAADIGLSFNLRNPRVIDAIQRRANRLTGHVTETSLQRVRDVIKQAQADGVGVSEIAKRIRTDAFDGEISRLRATTIARTETVGALNEGSHLAATEGGIMRAKRWLDQGDDRVRESHVAAAAEGWIAMDAPFGNGLQYPHEPGAPADEVIQCRCTAVYSDLTPADANRGPP